jgi:hypothetical protein
VPSLRELLSQYMWPLIAMPMPLRMYAFMPWAANWFTRKSAMAPCHWGSVEQPPLCAQPVEMLSPMM